MSKQIKSVLKLASVSLFVVSLAACGSSQDSGTDRSTGLGSPLDIVNKGLSQLGYSPDNDGYAYKAVAFPAADQKYIEDELKKPLEDALSKVGDGYVLQVTGHTCSIGPRNAMGGKKGNVWYSTQRAKGVYDALIKAGFPKDQLTYKGVADDELLLDADPRDAENRRVTFKIVPKQ